MKVQDLQAALRDFPPTSEVWMETELEFNCVEFVTIDENGDVVLSESPDAR